MATEKVKKQRKPRKSTKTISSKNKKAVERAISTTAKVLFKDKIQLYELPTLNHIEGSELDAISIDTSITGGNGTHISSYGTSLYRFSGIKDGHPSSDVPYLLDEAAAKRYHTKANELSAYDLRIFSDYDQLGRKNTYFNDHPYVVTDIDINSLYYDQLLTKNNLEEAERYFVNRFLNSKSSLQTFNWETDKRDVMTSDGLMTQEISGLNEMLDLDKWDSQATYKFEWGNDKKTSNIVDLNIRAAYYYSVVGIVSVKSILPDQKSGTIYLEAKPRAKEDNDNNWIVIDSAVFKFDQSNKNVGTYVTLSGYLSPKYVTRLRLNLHPNAYSMNNWEYREPGSISNHFSNTFVGTAYILDDVLSGDTIDIPIDIKFTDSNYRLYKIHNNSSVADLTKYYERFFEDSQIYTVRVSNIVDKIKLELPGIENLDISTSTQESRNKFELNGIRFSPTGRIYPLSATVNLYSNCVIYPSYSSGTITVQSSSLHDVTMQSSIGESWQNGRVLLNLNLSDLSALPSCDWPTNTEIYGNHLISGSIKQINISTSSTTYSYDTVNTNGPISFNNKSVVSWATYNPRRDNHLDTFKIDFEPMLRNYDLVGDITCHITASPNTYGGGGGNESWGRIRYGFTNSSELNDNNTSAISTIVSPVQLKTKNTTRWITNKMCTGSRWNVHAGTLQTSFSQSSRYKQIWIQACADTAHNDTKTTYFSVTANVKIYFKHRVTASGTTETTSTEEITSQFTYSTSGTREGIVLNTKIYPILSASQSVSYETRPSVASNFRVDNITATGKFNSTTLTVIPYPQNN